MVGFLQVSNVTLIFSCKLLLTHYILERLEFKLTPFSHWPLQVNLSVLVVSLAGLAACGVMMNIVSTASDLMQDFKTGYMTLASPRSMFASQVIGTAIGCVILLQCLQRPWQYWLRLPGPLCNCLSQYVNTWCRGLLGSAKILPLALLHIVCCGHSHQFDQRFGGKEVG